MKKPLNFSRGTLLLACCGLLMGTTAASAIDLRLFERGYTEQTVTAGQVGYVFDIEVASTGTSGTSTANLSIDLPSNLDNAIWDCLTFGTGASCGTNASGQVSGNSLVLNGLTVNENTSGENNGVVRILVQGTAPAPGAYTASATLTATNDTNSANNSSTMTVSANGFPELCQNVPTEIRRLDSVAATQTWPLNTDITVTQSVTSESGSTRGRGSTALAHDDLIPEDVEVSAAPSTQRVVGDFSYTLEFSEPVPANQIYLELFDISFGNPITRIYFSGGADSDDFAPVVLYPDRTHTDSSGDYRPLLYVSSDASYGRFYRQTNYIDVNRTTEASNRADIIRNSVSLIGISEDPVDRIVIEQRRSGQGDLVGLNYGAVIRCGDLDITKVADTSLIRVDDDFENGQSTYQTTPDLLTYTISVKNSGNAEAKGVVVTDSLPNNVRYISATPQPTRQTPLTFDLGTLDVDAERQITVTVDPDLPQGQQQQAITNVAQAQSSSLGVERATSGTAKTDVLYYRVRKSVRNYEENSNGEFGFAATGKPGDTLEYCIDVADYSTLNLTDKTLSDSISELTIPDVNGYGAGEGVQITSGGTTTSYTSADDADGVTLSADEAGGGTLTVSPSALPEEGRVCFRADLNKASAVR